MEFTKCPSCGSYTPGMLTRCKHCGEELPLTDLRFQRPDVQTKYRAGFVTFWLWFCIVAYAILTFSWFYFIFAPEPIIQKITTFVMCCCPLVGFILLLNWKKIGFYILIVTNLVASGFSVLDGETWFVFLQNFLLIVLLYVLLQVSKNGKTCWEQLS